MATVTESVKETLVGSSKPEEMSTEVRNNWQQYAKTGDNGEQYMDREAFINAIAPPDEDYVSSLLASCDLMELTTCSTRFPVSNTAPFSLSQTAKLPAALHKTNTLHSTTSSASLMLQTT